MRVARACAVCVCILCGFFTPLSVRADTPPVSAAAAGISLTSHAGYGGALKVGNWSPVIIEVANEGRDVSGELQVSIEETTTGRTQAGQPPILYTVAAILPSHSRKRLQIDALVPLQASRLRVDLVEGTSILAHQESQFDSVSANSLLCGAVTRDDGAYDVVGTVDIPGRQQRARVVTMDPTELPSRPQLLASLDCLILGNASLQALTAGQKNALDAWVSRGGILVGIGGLNWARSLPFLPAGLLPVDVNGSSTMNTLDALATFGHTSLPAGPWVVSVPKTMRGTSIVEQDGVPIVAVQRHGIGSVFYLALDPTVGPLRDWGGGGELWRYILSYANTPLFSSAPLGTTTLGWGRSPRNALTVPVNLNPPLPVWFVALLLGYLVMLGPVNYLLLRRLDRREWAWVTIPMIALIGSAGAFRIATQNKGSDVGINEISIVRTEAGATTSYVRTYASVSSPRDVPYEIVTQSGALITTTVGGFGSRPSTFGQGGPGSGTDPTTSSPDNNPPTKVMQTGATSLPNFKTGTNLLGGFTVDSVVHMPGTVTGSLTTDGTTIRGKVTNNTGQRINDAVLLVGDGLGQRIGTMPAGATKDVTVPLAGQTGSRRGPLSASLYPPSSKTSGQQSATDTLRKDVIDAAYNPFFQSSGLSGGGVSLLGWIDHSPVPISVKDGRSTVKGTTMYVAGLDLAPPSGQEVTIPAVVMNTRVLASLATNRQQGGGYDISSGGAIGLQFNLPFVAQFTPSKLVLRVAGTYGTSDTIKAGTDLGTAAWYDWPTGNWVDMPMSAGDNDIPSPERYVSASGQVRVRYAFKGSANARSTNLVLSQFDLSATGVAP